MFLKKFCRFSLTVAGPLYTPSDTKGNVKQSFLSLETSRWQTTGAFTFFFRKLSIQPMKCKWPRGPNGNSPKQTDNVGRYSSFSVPRNYRSICTKFPFLFCCLVAASVHHHVGFLISPREKKNYKICKFV